MKPFHLSRRLVLEAPVKEPDDSGGYLESWLALGVLWGDVRLRSGREKTGGVSETDYRIFVRSAPVGSSSRPVPGQRFVEGVRRFVIESVGDGDPKGRFLTCFVREELAT